MIGWTAKKQMLDSRPWSGCMETVDCEQMTTEIAVFLQQQASRTQPEPTGSACHNIELSCSKISRTMCCFEEVYGAARHLLLL
jgi:hypothetical protein